MKIAIVGATGILGRWLVPLLAKQGHAVLALTPSPAKARRFFGDAVAIAQSDLLDASSEASLPSLLTGYNAVAHIATALPRDLSVPGAMEMTNRLRGVGTERLLAASTKSGIGRYVQQSIVFSNPGKGEEWIADDAEFTDSNAVVANMERIVRASGLNWCIQRCGRFTGKDTYQEQTVADLRAGRAVVPGDGLNFVPLVHVADVASAFAAALIGGPANTTFNIAADPIRNGEYMDALAVRLGVPAPRRDPQLPRPASQRVSSAAAQAALGWMPMQSVYAYDI